MVRVAIMWVGMCIIKKNTNMKNILKKLLTIFSLSVIIGANLLSNTVVFAASNYYTNSSGNKVHVPEYKEVSPTGSSALCRDKTYSFSQHKRGTCSHHGGVSKWL